MPRALEASLALRWTRWTRVPWASSIKAKQRGTNPRKVTAVGTRCEHFIFLKKKRRSYFDHGWSACKQTDGRLFYWHKWCWSDYKQTFNPTVTQASNLFCNFGWKKVINLNFGVRTVEHVTHRWWHLCRADSSHRGVTVSDFNYLLYNLWLKFEGCNNRMSFVIIKKSHTSCCCVQWPCFHCLDSLLPWKNERQSKQLLFAFSSCC